MPEPIEAWEGAATAIEAWLAQQEIPIAELKRSDRRPHIVDARRKVAAYLREHGWSYPRIGEFLDRDHTTVMHMLKPRSEAWARRNVA